ncbi:MAG: HAD family hydrolase [Jiangellaceae bacterium]
MASPQLRSAPSTVVFDLGGVLVDWDPRYLFRRLLPDDAAVERFLTQVCTPEWNAAQDAGRSWADAVAEASARFPDHAELIAAYHERWPETVGGDIEGSVAILRDLHDDVSRLYALTNWSGEKFDLTFPRFEWLSWFDGIVVSGHERIVKPDPRIFAILLDRYRLDPSATVYVDDAGANVEAARGAGMTALLFTGPVRLRNDLGRLGVLGHVPDGRRPADP